MRRRWGVALALAVGACLTALAFAASAIGEPDNSIGEAGGPLASGVPVEGDVASQDRDFYFFYVTAPEGATLDVAAANLDGGTSGADFDVAIEDSVGGPVVKESFIRPGEERHLRPLLAPGKYFIEVAPNLGIDEKYRLSPGGSAGAFGTYAEILARCDAAQGALGAVEHKVSKAEGQLQRAIAKRRRSRFSRRQVRLRARREQTRAARRLAAGRQELRAAREAREPWCSIPA